MDEKPKTFVLRRNAAVSVAFSRGGIVMLRRSKAAVSFVLAAFSLMMVGTPDANAGSKLPANVPRGIAGGVFL